MSTGPNHPSRAPRRPFRAKQRGQIGGIISAVLALAVAAIGLMYIMGYFHSATSSENSQGSTNAFITMLANTKTTYNSVAGGYTGVTAAILINNGDVPSSMAPPGSTTITSPFGTPVTVASSTILTAGDSAAFSTTVPLDNCASFAKELASNVAILTVNGTTVVNSSTNTSFDPAVLGTACTEGGDDAAFVITITR